jgi:hypothetical protein
MSHFRLAREFAGLNQQRLVATTLRNRADARQGIRAGIDRLAADSTAIVDAVLDGVTSASYSPLTPATW